MHQGPLQLSMGQILSHYYFVANKIIKNNTPKQMSWRDVVMFLPNKIIKNKNLNYSQKNVGLAHGFKTMCKASKTTRGFIVHGLGGP